MTKQMRAARYHRYGPPAVLQIEHVPVPEPGRKEVLMKVRATSVNPAETLVRAGKMRMLSGFRFPKGTGQDFAGEVVAAGPGPTPLWWGGRCGAPAWASTPRRPPSTSPSRRTWSRRPPPG